MDSMDTDIDEPSTSRLLVLSFDLHLHLISFLEPPDILHLRMTCTTFYQTTSQPIVWIEALRQVCVENAVFLPTFPFADMPLDELEYAAMAPYKWLAVAARPPPADGQLAAASRFLSPLPSENSSSEDGEMEEEDDFDIRTLFLVPGGRYLVTFSWRWIIVWDLGYKPYRGRAPPSKAIARTKVPLHSMSLVHASPDGQALYILISYPINEEDEYSPEVFSVYEIYPTSASPQLAHVASLAVPGNGDISFYSLSGNRLIFLHDSMVKIWDFKTREWAGWTVAGEFHQSIITPDFILLLHDTGVSLWPIPPLISSRPPFAMVSPTPVPPGMTISYSLTVPTEDAQYTGPCDWYSGTPLPLMYDIATPAGPAHMSMQRCELEVHGKRTVSTSLREQSSVLIPVQNGGGELEFEPYRYCVGALVALWYESDTEATRICTWGAGARPNRPVVHTAMFTATHAVSCFCPVSGRFVYIEPDDDGGAGSDSDAAGVVILDFLAAEKSRPHSRSPADVSMDGRWMDELTGWTTTNSSPTPF